MDKPPTSGQEKKTAPSDAGEHSSEYAPYPKIDRGDVDPPPRSTVAEATPSPAAAAAATTMPTESNPYVTPSPVPASSSKGTMDSMRDALGKWGKKVGEATKKAEDLAGNVWQHLKTGPSLADAAMGRIAQGTKVIAEGGYEKIFQQTFDTLPEEQLKKSYACYLSTSAGPVMGTLYLSTAKLAFCSDTPLSYKVGDQTEWSYYKDLINGYELGILEYPHNETFYVLVCDKLPSGCYSSEAYLFPEDALQSWVALAGRRGDEGWCSAAGRCGDKRGCSAAYIGLASYPSIDVPRSNVVVKSRYQSNMHWIGSNPVIDVPIKTI